MIRLILGGQYGSEGKGSVSAWLGNKVADDGTPFDLAIRTGGANAGHTFVDRKGITHKMRQLPCVWDSNPECDIYLPAGAVIDPEVLKTEYELIKANGWKGKLFVSPMAAVVKEADKHTDAETIRSGTTGEGIGACRASKVMRQAKLAGDYWTQTRWQDAKEEIKTTLNNFNKHILIEASQGFGLSLNYGSYPFVTSTDLTRHQVLNDAEIPWGVHAEECWMVIRTFPIRIAGNSGPLFNETSWDELRAKYGNHIPTEQTTVTKKTRRVGEFDPELVKNAIRMCRPDKMVLTFVDYLFPQVGSFVCSTDPAEERVEKKFRQHEALVHYLKHVAWAIGNRIDYIGVAPTKLLEIGHLVDWSVV